MRSEETSQWSFLDHIVLLRRIAHLRGLDSSDFVRAGRACLIPAPAHLTRHLCLRLAIGSRADALAISITKPIHVLDLRLRRNWTGNSARHGPLDQKRT